MDVGVVKWQFECHLFRKRAATLLQNICKTFEMPNTNFKTDIRYEKAAKWWIEVPVLKCPEVMKISGFTDDKTKGNTIAKRVQRMKKTIK